MFVFRRILKMTAEEMKNAENKELQIKRRAAGELFCPGVFIDDMFWARDKCLELDNTPYSEFDRRVEIVRELFGFVGDNVFVERGFKCEQGKNISVGDNFYCNFNCTIYDSYTVKIGNDVMIGPNVTICTATHPVERALRLDYTQCEYAKPVTIGNGVWIGGGAFINPGVTIGDGAVIASGAVVINDVPANTVVAGVPAAVKKSINQEEK